MSKLFLSIAWLLLASGLLFTGVAGLQFYNQAKAEAELIALEPSEPEVPTLFTPQDYQSGGEVKGVETVLEAGDARAELVSSFLERHNSPLEPYDYYGQVFVDVADRYGFDFRLLPAIAMQESNLCKAIPEGSYNCLGFGVHTRGTLGFPNFEANFERAAKELKAYYIDIGLDTPEKIQTKYTPSSNGSWAASVNQWMAEMRYNDRQAGRDSEVDANVMEFAKPSPDTSVNQ